MTSEQERNELRAAIGDWYGLWNSIELSAEAAQVPAEQEVYELLTNQLGVDPVDAKAVIEARPDPCADPQLWWVLQHSYQHLLAEMGGIGMLKWPRLPSSWGGKGRFVYLYALLAAIPYTLAFNRQRGISDDISWATFTNLAEKLRLNRARYGVPGLTVAFWFTLHFRGTLYRLGRLDFALELLQPHHGVPGHTSGELSLGVHVPADGGPLTPSACQAAVSRAKTFFIEHFGDRFSKPPLFTCTSWLLDPQLREFLPASSNIIEFQNMFTLTPPAPDAAENGERDVLLFVFNKTAPCDPETLPRESRLHRHLADGFARGQQWQVRTGYFSA